MLHDTYLLLGLGILIMIDIGVDLLRIWNQSIIEKWLQEINRKLTELSKKIGS